MVVLYMHERVNLAYDPPRMRAHCLHALEALNRVFIALVPADARARASHRTRALDLTRHQLAPDRYPIGKHAYLH